MFLYNTNIRLIMRLDKQLFASKYLLYLPTEEELATEIERQRMLLKLK